MTSYHIKGISPTIGENLKLNGILASALLFSMQSASVQAAPIDPHPKNILNPASCNIDIKQIGAISTNGYGRHTIDNGTSLYGVPFNFESAISDFFVELSSKQEPLEPEFEQVLADNLWDLYQS